MPEGPLGKKREDHEPPAVIAKLGWRYHHLGVPTVKPQPGECYLEKFKVHVAGFETSPYGIEWMRFEPGSPVSDLIKSVPHIAFEVDDLEAALQGKELLGEVTSPSAGVRVAMIVDNGAPVELLEFERAYQNNGRPEVNTGIAPRQTVSIRIANLGDLEAITEIYDEAILTTTATFDTEPKSQSGRLEWFRSHGQRYPILVAVLEGRVVGWASLSNWSDRRAYDDTAETSFYVKAEHRGQGIGRRLKEAIIEEARRLRFHTLIARVAEGGEASLHLNESLGFVHVGTLKQVGRKFGRLLDVHLLQKILD